MNWHKEALQKIEKAPYFVRPMIQMKVEVYVTQQGRDEVSAQDVDDVKGMFMSGGRKSNSTPHNEIIEKEIRRIEKMTEEEGTLDSRYFSVKMCGGAMGCPMTLINVKLVAQQIAERIEHSDLPKVIESRIKGPLLTHHKFRVAVAGCPNCCSEPHIKDFGVNGQSRPVATANQCIACLQCVRTCKENTVFVNMKKVSFDYEACVNCGQCSRVCPTQAIMPEEPAYHILAGGKLGRHPQLAQVVAELVNEERVYQELESHIELLIEHGKPGERLGSLLNRLGIEYSENKETIFREREGELV